MENAKEKYKIGLFIDAFFPMVDGVIVGLNNIAKILKNYVDITVFTASPCKGDFDDSTLEYKVVRCRSMKIPFVKVDYDLPVPGRDKQFKKALEQSNLDLVHIRSPFSVGKAGLKYAKRHKIPSVITLHSQFKQDFYKATHSKLLAAIMTKIIVKVFNACDECWSVNEASKEVAPQYGIKHELVTMENGTDMRPVADRDEAVKEINEICGITKMQKMLLFTGRLVKVKNIFFIADTLKVLKDKGLDFKMVFIGDGAAKDELVAKLEKLGLGDNVHFTGTLRDRNEMAKYYVRADLFLFPSFYDTDGVVKKEAAAQKTPIICIEDTIVAKSVKKDHNAYIAPNDPEKFADCIINAFKDATKHKEVSENAFKEVYVTWEKTAEKTFNRYKELIEANKEKLASERK